jgi:NADPH2:quinone reductase
MTGQSIPSTMKAVQLDEPNGELTLREIPVPHPRAGQVLIRMAAAPINPSDLGELTGLSYSGDRKYPFTPGSEGSGTVVEAGDGLMSRFLKGRRVACNASLARYGTWAEYTVTSAHLCLPLSKKVSLEQGAMLLVNPLTAMAMFEIVKSGKHRAVVSTAAASALGGMLLQLGKRHNTPIIHVVRRDAQVDLVRKRGGEYILNSSETDFPEQLRAMAHKLGATLFLDAIGGGMTQQLADAAPIGSTILLYSKLSREDCVIDPFTALVKNLHFDGWFLPNWIGEKNLFQVLQLSRQVQSILATDLQSKIHRRVPLSAAQQALETYIDNMTAGKMLLVANPKEVALDK